MLVQFGKYIIKDWIITDNGTRGSRVILENNLYCGVIVYAKYSGTETYFVMITMFQGYYKLITSNNILNDFSSAEFKSIEEVKDHIDNFINNIIKFKAFL